MKKQIVGDVPGNVLGMMADLCHKLQHGTLTPEELDMFLKGQNPFGKENFLSDWVNFYQEVFNLKVDLSGIKIPAKRKGFDRLIIVAQGMTPQKLYDKCKELFPCWKYTDKNLDEIVSSERTSKNDPYAVWFRDRVEADEELKNLSANQLKDRSILGITLEERFLYELKYFKETGKHLDIQNITLCAGSRVGVGTVIGTTTGSRSPGTILTIVVAICVLV